jgi:hypothetical protein
MAVADKISDLAHAWAHGATDGEKHSVFIRGNKIYSYGRHYIIGTRIKSKNGGAFLYNDHTNSNTTNKHRNHVYNAMHGKVFHVSELDVPEDFKGAKNCKDVHKANVKYYISKIDSLLKQQCYAKSVNHLRDVRILVHELYAYCEFFGIKLGKKQGIYAINGGGTSDAQMVERFIHKYPKLKLTDTEAAEARKAAREAKASDNVRCSTRAWLEGYDAEITWNTAYLKATYGSEVLLRLKDGNVETSKGVRLTTWECKGLLAAITLYLENKETVRPRIKIEAANGSEYSVTEITPEQVIINCHKISMAEINKFASEHL